MNADLEKTISVIESMDDHKHIPPVRNYIKLFIKKHGNKREQFLDEMYTLQVAILDNTKSCSYYSI